MRSFITALVLLEAADFTLFSTLHLGLAIGPLSEPVIVDATIVEGALGVALLVAGCLRLAESEAANVATLAAIGLSIAGVLVGMAALNAGLGPRTELNDAYHRAALLTLVATGLLQLTSSRRTDRATQYMP
jgi:hypothetical protein